MNPEKSHQESLTTEEKMLIEAIRKNPALKSTISEAFQTFNIEVGRGMNELEAELLITEMTRKIGIDLTQEWASQSQQAAVEDSLQSSGIIKRGKKKSTGIPPSEKSS